MNYTLCCVMKEYKGAKVGGAEGEEGIINQGAECLSVK